MLWCCFLPSIMSSVTKVWVWSWAWMFWGFVIDYHYVVSCFSFCFIILVQIIYFMFSIIILTFLHLLQPDLPSLLSLSLSPLPPSLPPSLSLSLSLSPLPPSPSPSLSLSLSLPPKKRKQMRKGLCSVANFWWDENLHNLVIFFIISDRLP